MSSPRITDPGERLEERRSLQHPMSLQSIMGTDAHDSTASSAATTTQGTDCPPAVASSGAELSVSVSGGSWPTGNIEHDTWLAVNDAYNMSNLMGLPEALTNASAPGQTGADSQSRGTEVPDAAVDDFLREECTGDGGEYAKYSFEHFPDQPEYQRYGNQIWKPFSRDLPMSKSLSLSNISLRSTQILTAIRCLHLNP